MKLLSKAPHLGHKHKVLVSLILSAFLCFVFVAHLPAETEPFTLKVALVGPGSELYFWWGHIGLVVQNNITGESLFYDWGVFDFDVDNFFVNFAFGRLFFMCTVSHTSAYFFTTILSNRDIILYTLDLPIERKLEVIRFAENNVLPQNRTYNYHHFFDNCATRLRDIIDMAVDGQFSREFGEAPGRFTLRQHVRRHTWHNAFFDWALNFWMGQRIDGPTTVWEEMFLPSEVALRILDFEYIDQNGETRRLVSNVETVNLSVGRPPVLDEPRLQWPLTLIFSASLSLFILLLYFLLPKTAFRKTTPPKVKRRKGRMLVSTRAAGVSAFRVVLGSIQSALGLFFGIAGSMLFFMTFFSDHDYTYENINIIFVNPLFLALVPLGIRFAFTKDEAKLSSSTRYLRIFWAYVFIGGLFTMLMRLLPPFYQQNQVDLALVLPIALVLGLAISALSLKGPFKISKK